MHKRMIKSQSDIEINVELIKEIWTLKLMMKLKKRIVQQDTTLL